MIGIGESGGKGRGIFAARPIDCGERIESAPVVVVPRAQVTHLDATILGDYYFVWGEDKKDAAILIFSARSPRGTDFSMPPFGGHNICRAVSRLLLGARATRFVYKFRF